MSSSVICLLPKALPRTACKAGFRVLPPGTNSAKPAKRVEIPTFFNFSRSLSEILFKRLSAASLNSDAVLTISVVLKSAAQTLVGIIAPAEAIVTAANTAAITFVFIVFVFIVFFIVIISLYMSILFVFSLSVILS